MSEVATHTLLIDLDGDEIFEASGAVEADTVPVGLLIRSSRGVDTARRLSPPMAGTSRFVLDDGELHGNGAYDPTGSLRRGRRVRWRAVHSGTTYGVFRGLVESVVQDPALERRFVRVSVHGALSRLADFRVSTALFASITTDIAIGHLLDAAGYPKRLAEYFTAELDNLAGYWRLGEASGNAIDSSTNGNDGTVTIGAGARDAAALDDDGDGSIDFDGAATRVQITDAAAIQNIFAGGGSVVALLDPDNAGEGGFGRVADKAQWTIYVDNLSGSQLEINFERVFDTTIGIWRSTSRVIRTGEMNAIVVTYDADAVGNDPTIYVWNATDGLSTLTVGSGLTRQQTPVGTAVTDVGDDCFLGNRSAVDATFDGTLDELGIFTDVLAAAEAKSAIARTITAPRILDTGLTTYTFWWLDDEDALAALTTLLATEGPGAVIYEDGDGRLIFKDRQARVTETRSTTIQSTFRSVAGGARPLIGEPFTYDPGLRDVVNRCTILVKMRTVAALAVVWSLGEIVTLGPSESRFFEARQSDGTPFQAAVVPVEGTDFTVGPGGSVTSTALDRTSGASVRVTITAGTSGAVVTGLQLRAQSVDVTETTQLGSRVDVAQSEIDHGPRTFPLATREEISTLQAQDICDAVTFSYQNGRPLARLIVDGFADPTDMTATLARDVNDRIRIIDTTTGLDEEFYVERIGQTVQAPVTQRATLECLEIVATPFILGTSQLGGSDGLWF